MGTYDKNIPVVVGNLRVCDE